MRYAYLLFFLSLSSLAHAQDVILRTNGEEVPAKVLTIAPERISYVLPAAPADTLYLTTPDVFMIRYANGTKEMIRTITYETAELTPEQARLQGEQDAIKYFRAPGAFWGTFGATVMYLPAGIVTGAVIAANRPKVHNLVVPDAKLLQNQTYVSSYQRQAQRRKLGKAAAGFGTGVGALVVVTVVVVVAFLSSFN